MALPANDAFSFGLTGSHDPTRPAYTLSLRSTSPKIPFVSTRARSPPPHSLPRKTLRSPRSMSNGNADGRGPHEPHETRPHDLVSSRVDTAVLTRKGSKKKVERQPKVPITPPIDWEIPRKTLHSSIGARAFVLPVFSTD